MARFRLHGRLNGRFVLSLAVFAGVVPLIFRDEVMGPVLLSLRVLTARATLTLIHWIGLEAVREASAIYHPGGFAYQISRGCMGLVPAALLGVAVLAYPGELRRKLAALAVTLPLLFGLNFVRLVHLFYLGVNRPGLFHLAHTVLWQAAIVLGVFTAWLACIAWLEARSSTAPLGLKPSA
ncbi:MAG: hypothetical protein JSU87_01955 [Gemmatimonadota bacterium]|nr:MAG: hypothetical protein JSU87_01955 [Gemmatimonadota bacterium]